MLVWCVEMLAGPGRVHLAERPRQVFEKGVGPPPALRGKLAWWPLGKMLRKGRNGHPNFNVGDSVRPWFPISGKSMGRRASALEKGGGPVNALRKEITRTS